MNHVSDILLRKGKNTISVVPDTTVLNALQVMADNNIGSVVVMNNNEFLRNHYRKRLFKESDFKG